MNVLEKILEEIESLHNKILKDKFAEQVTEQEIDSLIKVKEIIHSHMGGATDTDDTEEKIREHIAECLRRIDNIRSFIGSKEYTSNDEKCIRNIEVLKTSITALEEYLSSKKKNGNDDWIPVEERLPKEPKYIEDSYIVQTENIITPFSAYWDGKEWTDVNDEPLEVIAWQPLPEQYRPKEKNNE